MITWDDLISVIPDRPDLRAPLKHLIVYFLSVNHPVTSWIFTVL